MDALGYVDVDSTIHIGFDTHGGDGERLDPDTAIETADFRIYKDGSDTQRTGVSGLTISETFDSMVGMHLFAIDLSDDDDTDFYESGSSYKVAFYPDETVNSQAVAKWIGSFKILNINNISAADVNAEVKDVMETDTHSEPGQGAPPASPTKLQMMQYPYKSWRNQKKQNSTTFELYNDAADTVDQKATVSDDGTDTTIGEIGTGP